MAAHATAKTRSIPRQAITSVSHPPTIRPARIPADIPEVTMPRTVARLAGSAKRPPTELSWAPTEEPAPTAQVTRHSNHVVPTELVTASAVAKAPNWIESTRRGGNR